MIGRLITTAVFFALGASAMYLGLAYHIVRVEDKTLFLAKKNLAVTETYVDIRPWTAEDFRAHPAVTQALRDHGHGELVPNQVTGPLRKAIKDVVEGILE